MALVAVAKLPCLVLLRWLWVARDPGAQRFRVALQTLRTSDQDAN